MGDWDRKSRYLVDLELQHRVLRIKNKRLKNLYNNLYTFVSSNPEKTAEWELWLSNQPQKELTEDEKRLEELENLTLIYAGEGDDD